MFDLSTIIRRRPAYYEKDLASLRYNDRALADMADRPRALLRWHGFPGAYHLAHRIHRHFAHSVTPMQLHRHLADAEIECDLLVQLPSHHLVQHLALTQ